MNGNSESDVCDNGSSMKSSIVMVNEKRFQKIFKGLPLYLILAATCISGSPYADQLFNDDIVVKGSICVGVDCNSGENFNFDTIRMRENNLRIRFIDSSNAGGFPTRDWEMGANESANGGKNLFYIKNVDNERNPFIISDNAQDNSIFIGQNAAVGFGTSTPAVELHILEGNSPTIRLDQDQSSGFSAQAWDIGGNETNFFVRDVSNSSQLPFRIQVGAPNAALYVAADGDIGFGTTTPDGIFDIAHPASANNHAVLMSSTANFGINIDNGFVPRGLLDINTTGGVSRFMVATDGKVGLNMGTADVPAGLFEVQALDNTTSRFIVDNNGNIGIGNTAVTSTHRIAVKNSAGNADIMALTNTGELALGTASFPTYALIEPTLMVQGKANTHHGIVFDTPTNNFTGTIIFAKAGTANWFLSSRNEFTNGNDRLVLFDSSVSEIISFEQGGKIGFGVQAVEAANAIQHSNGARLTTGGVWTNNSSRDAKKDIMDLSLEEAQEAIEELTPVTYEYITEPGETYVGFIAEDVPELVATNSRNGMTSMDVVAVLTKVVQEQQNTIKSLNERLESLENRIED